MLLRNILIVLQAVLYYMALPYVQLSVAAASIYTMPLIATALAILFLAEKGGLRIWAGVLIGYIGVLFIVQPQHDQFNYYVFLPLAAAVLAALANLVTQFKCADEYPLAISFNLNLVLLGFGIIASVIILIWKPTGGSSHSVEFFLRDWVSMGIEEWSVLLIMAIAFGIGTIATAIAYQIGPITRISTLDFSYIAFAVLWGAVFFGELPTSTTVLGILLICIAGTLVIRTQASLTKLI
jgi:drug/metabolite transporter (DMT)-like permease